MKNIPFKDKAVLFLATGFGSGFFPVAPGTAGSVVGVLLHLLVRDSPWHFEAVVLVALVGIPLCTRAEAIFGKTDDKRIVIDEVAGQMIALYLAPSSPIAVIGGFILFRTFDIFKFGPVKWLERLPAGYGVMLDDVGAGFIALAILQIIVYSLP